MIHEDLAEEILTTFTDADLSIIDEVLFFDGWTSYEEAAGYLIFRGIDGTIQLCEYGYYVMDEKNENLFRPHEITEERAAELIAEINDPNTEY